MNQVLNTDSLSFLYCLMIWERLLFTFNVFSCIKLHHLQQPFFLTKIALKIFQKKFPVDFKTVI